MNILNKYFDKSYCINLKRRSDRWDRVNKMFKDLNFNEVVRYDAVDGKTLDLSNIPHNQNLLLGELGIMETHIKLIKEAKECGYSSILIMEDDVLFTDEINKLDEYMEMVPDDWDMIYFGGNHIYGKTPVRINEKIIKLNFSVALQCVAIKNTIYDLILETTKPRETQIDAYYATLQPINNVYGFIPNMATQIPDFSDIQGRVVNYDNFFK